MKKQNIKEAIDNLSKMVEGLAISEENVPVFFTAIGGFTFAIEALRIQYNDIEHSAENFKIIEELETKIRELSIALIEILDSDDQITI